MCEHCYRITLAISGFLLLFLSGTASALDPHRMISQYAHTVWKVQDGFPRGPNAITQTNDGYVWISAGGDLLRYDGVTFSPLPPQESFQTTQGINSLLGSRDGSLWMATYQGGFSRLDKHGETFSFSIKKGGVNSIIEDHAGAIWIARDHLLGTEGALCRVAVDDLKCYGKDKSDGNPAHIATAIAEDSSGDVWFGCRMLCRWNGSSISHYLEELMDHPSGEGVVALAAGAAGSVWVALDGVGPGLGVRHYSNGSFLSYVVPGFDGATIRATVLFVDRQQTLWVGTDSQGLYHVHDGHADHYAAAQGLTGNEVRTVYEDREGNVWIATDKGVDLFRDTPIVSFSSTEGLGDAAAVIARNDGSVWVGRKAALAIIRGDSISLTTVADGHPIQNVYALLEDRLGQVWLGIDRTVMVYRSERFSKITGQDGRPLDHIGKIVSFTEDIDGNIWAIAFEDSGHLDHLLRIRDRRVQEDIDLSSLMPRRAHFLGADPAGGIWIGTGDGKLAHYLNGVVKIVYPGNSGGSRLTMFSLLVDSAGIVWGPTNRGIYRWDHGKTSVMDPHNGLPCPESTAALMDRSGSLWLEGGCGYERISAADLASWTARPEVQVTATTLGTLDGADSGWNEDRIQPNAAISADGRLWFVGSSSIQMIDPGRSYKNPAQPPVHIEGLVADGKSYSPSSAITLPPLTRDLHIDYTALSFVMPQRMGFRYILEGRDKGWQDPGLRREAFYSDLRPGSYRFRVIASNNDGVWNQTGATLDFTVAAAWYQMIWFRALCFVAGLLLLWAIYRLRVRRIGAAMKARFDERLAERTRIARDLHDTFLQTIQGSKLVADDALSNTTDPSHMRQAMEKLSTWLARATDEGRAALNSLRTSATEVNDLADAFRRALDECRIHGSMEVTFRVCGEIREMHPIVRDEVYRIGYEAIRNACVHSRATQLTLELSYAQDLSLRIADNGVGIDPDIVRRGKSGHFGLQSMRERAARIVGKFSVESSVGSGTVVTLTVPGGIIYRTGKG